MVNHEIMSEEVNVVSENGLIKMTLDDAIKLAEESGEDVIQINNGDIPVVKIMEYSKFIYNKKKKDKENKKKSRQASQEIKEIRVSDSIAEHDAAIKAKNIDRLLDSGNRVRIIIRYKGRLIRQINNGPAKIRSITDKVSKKFKVEVEPKTEGNSVFMVIAPIK